MLAWTINGKNIGGTRIGMDIARSRDIDVYNLFNIKEVDAFQDKYL